MRTILTANRKLDIILEIFTYRYYNGLKKIANDKLAISYQIATTPNPYRPDAMTFTEIEESLNDNYFREYFVPDVESILVYLCNDKSIIKEELEGMPEPVYRLSFDGLLLLENGGYSTKEKRATVEYRFKKYSVYIATIGLFLAMLPLIVKVYHILFTK